MLYQDSPRFCHNELERNLTMAFNFVPQKVKRGWMNLRVERILEETHDTKTFVLVDAEEGGRPFDYYAGQYLTFRFDTIGEKPLVRSYTMSSSPCEAGYSAFSVKKVEGGVVSNWLCDKVREGDVLRARGPIGKFGYDPTEDRPHLFMVGAGSGVTPFVSLLREYCKRLGQPGCPRQMTLLVSYRSTDDLICWPALTDAAKLPEVRVITTLSRENLPDQGFWHGRIDQALLEKAVGDSHTDATFMTCGPDAMMHMVKAVLTAKGVPDQHVKLESFAS